MEIKTSRIINLLTPHFLTVLPVHLWLSKAAGSSKTWLMISRTHINRAIIFVFMVLVGYSFAKAIQSQSVIGFILSFVSLGAGVYFLHLLGKAKEELEHEHEHEEAI